MAVLLLVGRSCVLNCSPSFLIVENSFTFSESSKIVCVLFNTTPNGLNYIVTITV